MNRKPIFLIALAFSCGLSYTHAQLLTGKQASEKISGATSIRSNPSTSIVEQIVFADKVKPMSDYEKVLHEVFKTSANDSWKLIRKETDQLGMEHLRVQQIYKGIEVENGVVLIHTKNGFIQSINGEFFANLDLSISPTITEQIGLETVLKKEGLANADLKHQESELLIFSDRKASYLTYKYSISAKTKLLNKAVYVDAITGKVIFENNHVCSIDVNGTGHTQFSGIQTVTTNQVSPTQFVTSETSRGNGIQTYDANTNNLYQDADNNWNNVNANMDEFAMDVHFGAEATYDFYFDNFGRSSYDGAGGMIKSYTNDVSVGVNAYWSGGTDNTMHYGNGDTDYYPVASLEVAGHELSHGVTEYTAGLIYMDESGALNESFSDIFGNTIRFLNAPSIATWYIGDQLLRPGGTGDAAFRNMANPNEFQNADCYQGLYFNNGDIVHFDSGIQNFWYYLLCEGGSGTNDLGNNYAVSAIGLNDAMRIAYRNLAFYLTPSSTFMDARLGSEQAAIDIFGLCSPQHLEVVHAWYAVGVGSNYSSFEANATFTISDNFNCVAPFTTNFSANQGYEHYMWDFGDGTTSTLEDPSHTYTSSGVFDVTLIVYNTTLCPSDDTLTITSAITVNPTLPVAGFNAGNFTVGTSNTFTDQTLYSPTSWSWDFGDGTTSSLQNPTHTYANEGFYTVTLIVTNCAGTDTITQQIEVTVAFVMCQNTSTDKMGGVLFDSGNETAEYQDQENCQFLIQPCNADAITLQFDQFDIEDGWDYLTVYDGANAAAPVLASLTGNSIPAPITSSGGSIYLAFQSDFSVTAPGFKISFTATPGSGTIGNAAFTMNDLTPVVGQLISFTDQSTGSPVSWSWNFGDGSTSSVQNPTHTYATNGTYTVTLIVHLCDNTVDTMTYSLEVGSDALSELDLNGSLLTVYPIPSTDVLHVQFNQATSDVALELVDLSGRVVASTSKTVLTDNMLDLDMTHLVNGQYILSVSFTNGTQANVSKTKVQKF